MPTVTRCSSISAFKKTGFLFLPAFGEGRKRGRNEHGARAMFEIFGIPSTALFGQLVIGLVDGSFYALLGLGLAIIFGMLNIINFAHGAQYMMGAFAAFLLLDKLGIGYWPALVLAPLIVGAIGIVIERLLLQWLYKLDHLYGLLLTFGLALVIEGVFRRYYGPSRLPYQVPDLLQGRRDLGFMSLPDYPAWVIAVSVVVCFGTWLAIERTRLGSYLRAATENPALVRAFGVDVPRMIMLTYGFGVALAALAGVLAAPIYSVSPQMGSDLIIVVFAVLVIGGMGSILGAILTGFGLGIVEGLTNVFLPAASKHGDLRHHGDRAADPPHRAVRAGDLRWPPSTPPRFRSPRFPRASRSPSWSWWSRWWRHRCCRSKSIPCS
jgi:branched-chain amino acid transport system permease protein